VLSHLWMVKFVELNWTKYFFALFPIWCRFRKAGTVINFWVFNFAQKKIYHTLNYVKTHCILSFVKKIFCNFSSFLIKWCFEPKKVDEKSSNGHNFPLTEPNCKYLSILERSYHIEFEKNMTKKFWDKNNGVNNWSPCKFFVPNFFWSYFFQILHGKTFPKCPTTQTQFYNPK
jgi:hypothetical protein